jgi:hypothetical protein
MMPNYAMQRTLGNMFDLAAVLPRLLPGAIAWAEAKSAEAASSGIALSQIGIQIARKVGVRQPELVRIRQVPQLPLPEDPELRHAALETGLLGPGMVGLTLGHSIFIVTGHSSNRLVSHECRHVAQYEAAGSIAAFLPQYLQQIVAYGYENAPFEIDARQHETDVA